MEQNERNTVEANPLFHQYLVGAEVHAPMPKQKNFTIIKTPFRAICFE